MWPTGLKQKSLIIKGNVRPQHTLFGFFGPNSFLTYPYRIDLSKNPGEEDLMLRPL
jgi:hypothetical protein